MLWAGVLCVVVSGCAGESEPDPAAEMPVSAAPTPASEALPAVIVANRTGFIPEGVEYDMANGRLLTGSLSEGSVFEIGPDGQVTEFVNDPELVSSVGIEADEAYGRLFVANADRSVFQGEGQGQAKLGVYDLSTGSRLAMVDLASTVTDPPEDAAYFANDVAVADNGTAYVTDTRLSAIYEVSTEYEASLLHRFDDGGSGPNGIVYHPAGFLLVARGATLWKVPVDDPATLTEVLVAEEITGQDGMVWSAMRLVIVSNDANRIVALRSEDEWGTAEVVGVGAYEPQATTAAVVGDAIYVVHPHFADDDPPSVSRVELQ
jgi:sugar lactone lactonase YvrE|tara:strand:- start:237 stop:1193 length:957 start_codon:yes stop_codon:yes gene_type:complete